jgi:uncharacterized protein with PIN domain
LVPGRARRGVPRLFVDTSANVALAFGEPGYERVRDLMSAAGDVFASPLLEAEFRATLEEHLRDVLDRGGRVRIVTGDYLGLTQPEASRS